MSGDEKILLEINDLFVNFYTYQGVVKAIDGVDLTIRKGETLGLVGETGCGKSVTARAIMRLIQSPPGRIEAGSVYLLEPPDVRAKRRYLEEEARKWYSRQTPAARTKNVEAFSKMDKQFKKQIRKASKKGKPTAETPEVAPPKIVDGYLMWESKKVRKDDKIAIEASKKSYDLLKKDLKFMQKIRGRYISMIFQEPAAALNPVFTAGDQIAEVILVHKRVEMSQRIQKRLNEEIELAKKKKRPKKKPVSAKRCTKCGAKHSKEAIACRVCGNTEFTDPKTGGRKNKIYRCSICNAEVQKEWTFCDSCGNEFYGRVSWKVRPLFLKTYRKIFRTIEKTPDSSYIRLMSKIPLIRRFNKDLQEEAFREAVKMLKVVRIPDPKGVAYRFPHELSGGMQQRVMIGMALACNPKLLIADEPTTALDVTIQAQILKLMRELKTTFGSSILLITHNLGVVAEMCDRVGVMYAGSMAEIADARTIFKEPLHPYTVGLMLSVPNASVEVEKLYTIPGSVPNLIRPPSGCRFHPRCSYAKEFCKEVKPPLTEIREGHFVACHKVTGASGYA
jgi:peptide/nickel transport system ATP-binding protein